MRRRFHGEAQGPDMYAPGPPWRHGHRGGEGPPTSWRWHWRGRFMFLRFAAIFGLIALLIAGWMATLAFLLTRLAGGSGPTALLVWISGLGLALVFPFLVVRMVSRAFRGIALPLSDLMAAADAVAQGDLSVRVPVNGRGDFRRLSESFNRMTAELERADQQRRNLTADVAHELRTPLHVIQGNLEGIIDGVYEPTAEHINATLGETRTLARLVEDLRTLSLAEAGQLPLALEPVDVGELLADVVTSFSGQAEAAGIYLLREVSSSDGPLVVVGDAGRLDQVLSNLMANALRYTPAGGTIILRAELLPASAAGEAGRSAAGQAAGGVRIILRDTGEGIPAADLPYIFDRFWRGDPARSHARGGGSGLGLAIARQLVQAHQGQIEVESRVGAGTQFTIDLPARPERLVP